MSPAGELIRSGFRLGVDFAFVAVLPLEGSGVPAEVLADWAHKGILPIRLEAEYQQYNEPRFTGDAVTLTLSFGSGLHDCTFPYDAIASVSFFGLRPEGAEEEPRPVRPALRLVEDDGVSRG